VIDAAVGTFFELVIDKLATRGTEELALEVHFAVHVRTVAAKLLTEKRLLTLEALPAGFVPQTITRLEALIVGDLVHRDLLLTRVADAGVLIGSQ